MGKAYRIAPCVSRRQAASFWKFWASGNEVYATSRNAGHLSKISVHQSGQIHASLGAQKRQLLARPSLLVNEAWLHAFELRFLISPGAFRPPQENLKNKWDT